MRESLGHQLTIDFYNCDAKIINCVDTITSILEEGTKMMNLSKVKTVIHQFSPIGISGVIVIKESHIAIHTWPEHNYVALDFFTCNHSHNLDEGIQWIQEKLGSNCLEKNASQRGYLEKIQEVKNKNMELQSLIIKYNLCEDDDRKTTIIHEEFEDLEDYLKWDFLLKLLDDKDTYDLVKVEIYKIIEIAKFNEEQTLRIKDSILQSLHKETDELVKQWGFMGLEFHYCDFPDIIELCVVTIEDTEEDENVKYNALNVLERSENKTELLRFKERLLKVQTTKRLEESIAELF